MALAVTQLRSSLDLNQVEPWFPPKSLWDAIDKMVGEFTEVDEAVVAVVHVVDIISMLPMGSSLLVNSPLNPINNIKISIIIFCVNSSGHHQIIAHIYIVSYADGPKP